MERLKNLVAKGYKVSLISTPLNEKEGQYWIFVDALGIEDGKVDKQTIGEKARTPEAIQLLKVATEEITKQNTPLDTRQEKLS